MRRLKHIHEDMQEEVAILSGNVYKKAFTLPQIHFEAFSALCITRLTS